MNCEKCQELLDDFLDGTLSGENYRLLGKHLDDCFSCANVRDEMNAILNVAQESRWQYVAPPNEHALWLRIRNTIEGEIEAERIASMAAAARTTCSRASIWTRLMGKRWELTLPQLVTAVSAIVVAVSLFTTLSLTNFLNNRPSALSPDKLAATNSFSPSQAEMNVIPAWPRVPAVQQVEMEYLMQRVEQRKASWNPRTRDAFERSMFVIEQAVAESVNDLNQNPHDEVSEEMLDTALRGKIKLLKEFSEY